jgi:hypothetical protein
VSDDTQAEADAYLGAGGRSWPSRPGPNWVGKTWPAERFAVLAARLLRPDGPLPDGRLLLVGGQDDRGRRSRCGGSSRGGG